MKLQIRQHRKELGWTLAHLAERVGTSSGHLSDIETGKREASLSMLRAIAQALGITEMDLFTPSTPAESEIIRHMRDFSKLSPADRDAVARHARGLLKKDDE